MLTSLGLAQAYATVETESVVDPTKEWLARSHEASCGITNDWVEGNCQTGGLGSFRLTEAQGTSLSSASAACLRACSLCERCRYISVSAKYKDCSWYNVCPRPAPFPDTRSGPGRRPSHATTAPCSDSSTASTPLLDHNQTEVVDLSRRYAEWARRLALPAQPLNDSVVLTEDTSQADALARFLRKLQRKKAVARIAFLGGSLTFGHGVHQQNDTWPEQFRRALHEVWGGPTLLIHNGALPATTAAFGALCFDTLVPFRPDLVLIEYSHNTPEFAKLEMLLSTARRSGAAVLIVDYGHVHKVEALAHCASALRTMGDTSSCRRMAVSGAPFEPREVRFFPFLRASGMPVISWRAFGPWLLGGPASFFARHVAEDARHLSAQGYALLAATAVHFLWRATLRLSGHGGEVRRYGANAVLGCGGWAQPLPAGRATCTIGTELKDYVSAAPLFSHASSQDEAKFVWVVYLVNSYFLASSPHFLLWLRRWFRAAPPLVRGIMRLRRGSRGSFPTPSTAHSS